MPTGESLPPGAISISTSLTCIWDNPRPGNSIFRCIWYMYIHVIYHCFIIKSSYIIILYHYFCQIWIHYFDIFWLLILDPWSLAKHHRSRNRSTGFTSGHRSSGGNSAFSSRQLVAKTWPPRNIEGHRDEKSHCDRLFWVLLVLYYGSPYDVICMCMYNHVYICICRVYDIQSRISNISIFRKFLKQLTATWLPLRCQSFSKERTNLQASTPQRKLQKG